MHAQAVQEEFSEQQLKNAALAGFLSWLVPGLGQWYQGRRGKAVLFFACISFLLVTGQVMGEGRTLYWSRPDPGLAMPSDVVARLRYTLYCMGLSGTVRLPIGAVTVPCALQWLHYEDGPLPLLGKFCYPPTKAELAELNARLNQRWEIAVLYTMVAGLLNALVILDAVGGPAAWYYARRHQQLASAKGKRAAPSTG